MSDGLGPDIQADRNRGALQQISGTGKGSCGLYFFAIFSASMEFGAQHVLGRFTWARTM